MNNSVIINELNAHLLEVQTRALEMSDWLLQNGSSMKNEIVCCKEMYRKAYERFQFMRQEITNLIRLYDSLSEDLNQMREYAFFYKN